MKDPNTQTSTKPATFNYLSSKAKATSVDSKSSPPETLSEALYASRNSQRGTTIFMIITKGLKHPRVPEIVKSTNQSTIRIKKMT